MVNLSQALGQGNSFATEHLCMQCLAITTYGFGIVFRTAGESRQTISVHL
jgi:hypothetical protein